MVYVRHYNTGYVSTNSKTRDTTHGAPFHATVSIMLLIHAVLMAAAP